MPMSEKRNGHEKTEGKTRVFEREKSGCGTELKVLRSLSLVLLYISIDRCGNVSSGCLKVVDHGERCRY